MRNVLAGLVLLAAVTAACADPAPVPRLLDAGGSQPLPTQPPRAGAIRCVSVENGKKLFSEKGCIACHTTKEVAGAVGTVGPNLDGVASRTTIAGGAIQNTPANLRNWLRNPPAMKPGTQMASLGLNPLEIDNLIELLNTLK